jgi:uncharacterized protein
MIKAVVDTNVLVSALIKPSGIPAQFLTHTTPFILVTSEEILTELERVLHYSRIRQRYTLTEQLINNYITTLRAASEVVQITHQVQGVSPDPDDDKFLACAVSGQANYLVSGDPHLTGLHRYQTTTILTPRQFLAILQACKEVVNPRNQASWPCLCQMASVIAHSFKILKNRVQCVNHTSDLTHFGQVPL